ncbi:MAG: DDE-type integrase/transposase/recombinase [Flavobacteriales bacterium]|nr:DDE-type integrase/transposase/recombinase [Flavobacteriales bacterium]
MTRKSRRKFTPAFKAQVALENKPANGHRVYPYLLRGVQIEAPGHVWSTDITYIAMGKGFLYLTAVMDWHSRYVLSWRIGNTLDTSFCRKLCMVRCCNILHQ